MYFHLRPGRLISCLIEMLLTRTRKAGLVLLGLGLLVFLIVAIWLKTIKTTVVEIPMPMLAEATTTNFTVDRDGDYDVSVRFAPNLPQTTAECLLGGRVPGEAEPDCGNTAPVLKFSWELSRDGQSGGTGSSHELGSSWTIGSSLNVMVVSFPAQVKHKYTLALKFDQNASDLKMPPPIVGIELSSFSREDFIFAGAALDFVGLVLCLIGVVIFGVSLLRAKFKKGST